MILTLFFTLIAIAIASCIRQYYLNVRKYPRGPRPLPIVGNLLQIKVENLHLQLDQLAKRYGPIFTVFLPQPFIIITSYEHIKEALVKKADAFSGRSGIFPDTILQTVENGGIIGAWGDSWRSQRRISLKILRDFGMGKNIMEQRITNSIDQLLVQLKAVENTDNVDMQWPLQLCVANIIMELLFGYSYSHDDCEKLQNYIISIEDLLAKIMNSPRVFFAGAYPWFKQIPCIGDWLTCQDHIAIAKKINQFIIHEVDHQCAAFDIDGQPDSFVQAYFKAMCAGEEQNLNMDQLHDVAMDIWVASMETTTATLRWAIALLTAYPKVQEKMSAELARVVGQKHQPVTLIHKSQLSYCQATLLEIQRFANIIPVNIVHKTEMDTELAGFHIPAHTLIIPQISSVLRNEELFDDPENFNPERFLADDNTILKETADRVIVFSLGKRQCMGEGLARTELFLVLLNLLQNYRFAPVDGIESVNLERKWGAIVTPTCDRYRLIAR